MRTEGGWGQNSRKQYLRDGRRDAKIENKGMRKKIRE